MITTPNPIRFYTEKTQWIQKRAGYKHVKYYPSIYCPLDRLPTFNLLFPYTAETPEIEAIRIDSRGRDIDSIDLTSTLYQADLYKDDSAPLVSRITNYANNSLLTLTEGLYYVKLTLDTNVLYSEPFYVCGKATDGVKVEFTNTKDLTVPDVVYTSYQIAFKQRFYIDGTIEPTGETDSFTKEVKKFDNTTQKVYERVSPIYQVEFVANYDFATFLQFMSIHDTITIGDYEANDVVIQRSEIAGTPFVRIVLKFTSVSYINGDNSIQKYTFTDGTALLNTDGTPILNTDGTPLTNLR